MPPRKQNNFNPGATTTGSPRILHYEKGGYFMTDKELLALPKVGPSEAARYLQNGVTPQEIRVKAQNGVCPFCTAEKMNGRYRYRVNVGMLIRFKNGQSCDEEAPDTPMIDEGKKTIAVSRQNWELLSTNTFTQENKNIMWEVVIRSWKKLDH